MRMRLWWEFLISRRIRNHGADMRGRWELKLSMAAPDQEQLGIIWISFVLLRVSRATVFHGTYVRRRSYNVSWSSDRLVTWLQRRYLGRCQHGCLWTRLKRWGVYHSKGVKVYLEISLPRFIKHSRPRKAKVGEKRGSYPGPFFYSILGSDNSACLTVILLFDNCVLL